MIEYISNLRNRFIDPELILDICKDDATRWIFLSFPLPSIYDQYMKLSYI